MAALRGRQSAACCRAHPAGYARYVDAASPEVRDEFLDRLVFFARIARNTSCYEICRFVRTAKLAWNNMIQRRHALGQICLAVDAAVVVPAVDG